MLMPVAFWLSLTSEGIVGVSAGITLCRHNVLLSACRNLASVLGKKGYGKIKGVENRD
jgi:hypothetical protein